MEFQWGRFIESNGALTDSVLREMLRKKDAGNDPESQEYLSGLAKYLVNSASGKFDEIATIDNNMIIQCLNDVDEPGTMREIIKTWLIIRLFKRAEFEEPKTGLRLFRAQPASDLDFAAATQLVDDDKMKYGAVSNSAFLAAATHLARGEARTAYRHFDEMRKGYLSGEFISHFTRGSLSTRSLEEFETAIEAGEGNRELRAPIRFASG
ncbi:MAG: hypothetical protein ABI832_16520 [bacterium]